MHTVTFTVDDGRGGTDSETISVRVVDFRFKFVAHRITTEAPSFVNVLFQVLDLDNWGVTALTSEHFEVREDDQVVSPSESAMRVQKRKALPHRFKLKTVLMLDTSTSVRDQLEQIKEAAIVLVENMTENQEIALYEFSEDPVLLQDFTNDVEALTKAIREIRLGFSHHEPLWQHHHRDRAVAGRVFDHRSRAGVSGHPHRRQRHTGFVYAGRGARRAGARKTSTRSGLGTRSTRRF